MPKPRLNVTAFAITEGTDFPTIILSYKFTIY